MRQTLSRVVPAAVFAGGIAVLLAIYADYRSQPRFARAESTIAFETPAMPGAIVDAIAKAYGVYVHFEYPCEPGGASAYFPKVYPAAEPGDPLQRVFDDIVEQTDGLLQAITIEGELCVVPSVRAMHEHRSNLDRVISVRIGEVSAFDALKSIVEAVNQYHVPDYPLRFNPGGIYAGFAPPDAFLNEPIRPLHANGITAREAVTQVIARTDVPCSWVYGHMRDAAFLTIRFYENGKLQKRSATPEEKARWDAYIASQP